MTAPENVIAHFEEYEKADHQNDLVGMCQALVNIISIAIEYNSDLNAVFNDYPRNYYKLDPHLPDIDKRDAALKSFKSFVFSIDDLTDVTIQNLYNICVVVGLIYHMPINSMISEASNAQKTTREKIQQILLDDNMSPNWIKS